MNDKKLTDEERAELNRRTGEEYAKLEAKKPPTFTVDGKPYGKGKRTISLPRSAIEIPIEFMGENAQPLPSIWKAEPAEDDEE